MKIVLVQWTLLLFGASLSSGHYIRQSEDNSNVYSVQDGPSEITFVNPKPKEPTLREILYYHVIERKLGEQEHPITERSFTNSHGYQFLEKGSDEQEQYSKERHDEYLHNEHEDDENELEELDANEHEESNDELHGDEEEEIENQDEDGPESTTTPRALTDADVKDAYKTRSYLFDQMRQRYAVKRMADSLYRKKREADTEELKPLPDAPRLSSDIADTDVYTPPKTYGMNIKPEGGYVWNNLNKPNSYYEIGASSGSPSEGQNAPPQSAENTSTGDNANEGQGNSENSGTSDSDAEDLSDICVNINKPCALPLQSQEPNAESSEASSEYSEINKSTNSDESMVDGNGSNHDSGSVDGVPNYSIGSVAFENLELSSAELSLDTENKGDVNGHQNAPNTYGMSLTSGGGYDWNEVGSSNENSESSNSETNYPVEPIIAGNKSDDSESDDGYLESSYPVEAVNSETIESDRQEDSQIPQESSMSEGGMDSAGSNENAGSSDEELQQEEFSPGNVPEESAEGEKLMTIPEAPTLSPLNYDNLPSYINGDITSSDKPASYEQTDSPYTNPQPYPEDTKPMEDILVTMQPPEDIPKTYGMNLTSDGGHVWNTLVNPPVSYDIGSSNETPAPINPIPEPNTSDANNPAEPIISGDANINSESNEGVDNSQGSISSEMPEPSYPVPAAENPGSMESADNQPDEPQTYGMNFNPDGGPVWNTMVNPDVSYDIGSSSEQPEPNNSEAIPTDMGGDASNDNSESNEGGYLQGPEVNLEPRPIEPVVENPAPTESNTNNQPEVPNTYGMNTMYNPPVYYNTGSSNEHSASSNENSEHKDSENESNESYGSGYGDSQSEEKPGEENSEGEKPKEPYWNIPEAPTLPPLNYDNLSDYIKNVISSTEKPGYYQPTDSPTTYTYPQTSSEDKTMEDKMEDIFATIKPGGVPNTYGMSLNGNGGHVWNDMVNPPVSYDVGAPSQSEEEHKEEQQIPEVNESEEASEEQPTDPAEPEIQVESEETNQEPEPEPETPETEDESIEIPDKQEPVEPETTEEFENPELNPEPEHENKEEVELPEDVEEPSEENHSLEEKENEPAELKPEKETAKPDIMDELLKSEQFWRWLGIWTATYMEILEKHIRKIALEEICNHQRTGNQMCPIKDNSEESGVIMKDEKDAVDDKEMDLKDTDNIDAELKRGHYNQNNHKKGDGNKIEASTIYGNSVGNEKVTNVFIFTADKADEVIDKLKPANDSEIDYIIDERIKEEENKDNIEAPGDYSANKEDPDVDDVSKEEPIKAEANNEDINKEEASEEQSEESDANVEANKEELIESAVTNEEKEEINKEEAISTKSNEEELNKGEENKQESNKSESNEKEVEKLENSKEESDERESNNEELEKEQSNESEPNKEGLDKEEASQDVSKEGEAGEEDSKEDSNKSKSDEEEDTKEENKEGTNEDAFNKYEESKEGATEGDPKEEVIKEASNEKEENDNAADEEELNKKEENTQGSTESEADEGVLIKEQENKKQSSDDEKELNKEVKADEASEGSNESKENSEPVGKTN